MPDRQEIVLHVQPAGAPSYQSVPTSGQDHYLIGRNLNKDRLSGVIPIILDDDRVSRRHCVVLWDEDQGWMARDLNSTNGTQLNGRELNRVTPIGDGARLLIGTTLIRVEFLSASAARDRRAEAAAKGKPSETSAFAGSDDATFCSDGATIVGGAVGTEADVEATMVRRVPAGAARLGGDDATMVGGGDAVRAEGGDATMVGGGDGGGVTVFSAAAGSLPRQPGGPSAPQADTAATMVASAKDAGTLLAGATSRAKPVAPPPPGTPPGERRSRAGNGQAPVQAPASRTAAVVAAPTPSQGELGPTPRIMRDVVDRNLIDITKVGTLVDAARHNGTTIFRALADDAGIRFKDEIFDVVAEKTGVEFIKSDTVLSSMVQRVSWLELDLARSMGVLPMVSDNAAELRYATIDPFNVDLGDWILGLARRETPQFERAVPVMITSEVLVNTINRLRALSESAEDNEIGVAIDITLEDERQLVGQLENVDVPGIVNFFIHRGFSQGASDIHIEPTETTLLVRNRVDGILHDDSMLPMALHPEVSSRIKIMSGMDVAEKRRPQDGRISAVVRGSPIDVRVSTYPTVYGEKVVMRLLDKNALRPSSQSLGLLPGDLRLLLDKLGAPFGLIMISGPTGSGKTTTLYSCLGSIDKTAKNVLTVEDPVEYRLAGVHQMQVNDKIGLTFASGLRTILRQDPDVIMVGECRDSETAGMAIQASLTGHIVFSTIHTNDAIGVVTRLLDMGIDAFLVANAISLAIAQRLVRKICDRCRTKVMGKQILHELRRDGVSEERMQKLGIDIDPDINYVHGVGCMHCRSTGYHGRQPVFEMFEMTSAARALITSSSFDSDKLRELSRANGMMTLVEHGLRLVEEGLTTHEEVIRVLGETA
ncbi:MAG: Flp pilus assembly complex ATPase component TadA [Alphaproteobacteria bacterium]|nr:Flp pilus assembly complex ATPase component TadA [Alphaproteobacteria bacterium]